MLGHSRHSSEVATPSHPLFSLTYTTPPRLTESQGYTDITVMTDEEGVEERYQPTKSNLVRNFPQPLPTSTAPNNTFFQKREIRALSRQVQPGDRRVFYCTNLSPPTFGIVNANLPPQPLDAGHSEQMPCRTGSEEDGMDEGMYPQPLDLFMCIERSVTLVLVALGGRRIRDNVRTLCHSARFNAEILTFLLDTQELVGGRPSQRFHAHCDL